MLKRYRGVCVSRTSILHLCKLAAADQFSYELSRVSLVHTKSALGTHKVFMPIQWTTLLCEVVYDAQRIERWVRSNEPCL